VWKALWSAIQKRGFHYYDWKSVPADFESVDANIGELLAKKQELTDKLDEIETAKKLTKNKDEKAELTEEIKALKEEVKAWNAEYGEVIEQMTHYKKNLLERVYLDEYTYPCYMEAARLGLWEVNPITNRGQIFSFKQGNQPQALAQNERLVPRAYRIKELKSLWSQAQRLLTQLQAFEVDYLLFGEAKAPYATVWQRTLKAHRGKGPNYLFRRRGDARLPIAVDEPNRFIDTQGVLGQKVPRFDNRIIAKCQLMPTRNVCNAKDPLASKVGLMLQLKNTRFIDSDGVVRQAGLTPAEFNTLIEAVHPLLNDKGEVTYTKFVKALEDTLKAHGTGLSHLQHPALKENIKVNISGRSRFCRPALKVIHYTLTHGDAFPNIDPLTVTYEGKAVVNASHPQGVTAEEVVKTLKRLGTSWESFSVGDDRDDTFALGQALQTNEARRHAVMKLLGRSNNPIVRNRMLIFYNKLVKLEANLTAKGYNVRQDAKVIIEFIRGADSGFDGKKKGDEWTKHINANEKENEELLKELRENGLPDAYRLRLKLFKQQRGQCAYTLDTEKAKLSITDLGSYEIDHIYPFSLAFSSDAVWNKVLVRREANQDKAKQTPYQWLHGQKGEAVWQQFIAKVEAMYAKDDKSTTKKKALLTSPNPEKQMEKYTGLAETATMARLAQQVLGLHFAWPLQVEGQDRRIFVSDGAWTSRIRSRYDLGRLLLDNEKECALDNAIAKQRENYQRRREAIRFNDTATVQAMETTIKEQADILKKLHKDRTNSKHHALDAFCISFSQDVRPSKDERGRPKLKPSGEQEWTLLNEDSFLTFKQALPAYMEALFPQPYCRNKSKLALEETIYGYRKALRSMVVRKPLFDLLKDADDKKIKNLSLVDKAIEEDLKAHHKTIATKKEWNEFLETYPHPTRGNRVKAVKIIPMAEVDFMGYGTGNRSRFGELQDMGNGQTKGQYKKAAAHNGQIVYQDKQGKWNVFTVPAFMSELEARATLASRGIKTLFSNGDLLYPSLTVRVKQMFLGPKGIMMKAGLYTWKTMNHLGYCIIEDANGFSPSGIAIAKLISVGLEIVKTP
jgi:CRISPR-associated endonuclease Csn1